MKKRFLRIPSLLIVFILLVGCFPFVALAESQTTELFTLSETRHMGISVKYETEPPKIEFIAPNGDVYGDEAISDGRMTKTDSGTALFFRIPNAMAGTWQIKYDKKSNANIEVSYAPYGTSIVIESLSFLQPDESALTVQFHASHEQSIYYQYSIYAVVTENDVVIGQKLLSRGRTMTNNQYETTVYLHDLASYSSYKLMLEVEAQDGGLVVFDSKVSDESFGYTNPYAPEAPENFYLEIGAIQGTLLMDWSNTAARGRETLVAVYFNDEEEPKYFNSFDTSVYQTEIVIDLESTKTVRVDISYEGYNGRKSLVASRTVDMSLSSAIVIEGKEISNSAQAEIVYNLAHLPGGPFRATLKVNDVSEELSLQGNGAFSLNLNAFQNKVDFLWCYDEFTAFRLEKELYYDSVAPMLSIPGMGDKVITGQNSYILSGYVDAGCGVLVDGTTVPVDGNGIFTTTLSLSLGENVFTVVAVGPNGNRTQQTIIVEWVMPSAEYNFLLGGTGKLAVLLSYAPLIICILLSIVLCAFVVLSQKKFMRIKNENGKKQATLCVVADSAVLLSVLAFLVTAGLLVTWIFLAAKLNSAEFYDMVNNSGIDQAYELLQIRDNYMWRTIISAVCLAVSVGVSLLFKKLSKKQPKQQDNQQTE